MMLVFQNKGYSNVFPQANDIYKIMRLGQELIEQETSNKILIETLKVTTFRQLDYYLSAGIYLGIFSSGKKLTQTGELIFTQDKNIQLILLCQTILSNYIVQKFYLKQDAKAVLDCLIKDYSLSVITANRRLNTVKHWADWCEIIIQDFDLKIVFKEAN